MRKLFYKLLKHKKSPAALKSLKTNAFQMISHPVQMAQDGSIWLQKWLINMAPKMSPERLRLANIADTRHP